VARLPASTTSRGRLRFPRRARRIGRRRQRRVLGVLPEARAQLGVFGLELRDTLHQPGDLRLELGDARVAWIQLRHRERRSQLSPSVDPPRPRDRSHGTSGRERLRKNKPRFESDDRRYGGWLANAEKAREQRELSTENQRLVDVSYKAGAATAVEQADATAALRSAEFALQAEELGAQLAALQVLQAAGAASPAAR
jgi:hypothetical protein